MKEYKLLAAVEKRRLVPFCFMVCPQQDGEVSEFQWDSIRNVPKDWSCTCGKFHPTTDDDLSIQFRRP